MFLLSKLDEISGRFPRDVSGVRAFLLDRGIPATTPEALTHFSARLAIDPSFRRDVTSIVQAVIRREKEAVDYMDLLAILVVAATGDGVVAAGEAQEESVREILRFLTHVRRPAVVEDAAASRAVVVPAAYVEPVAAAASVAAGVAVEPRLPVVGRASYETEDRPADSYPLLSSPPSPLSSRFDVEEVAWWRGRAAWVVGAAALAVGLGLGWLLHHERAVEPDAAVLTKSVVPAGLPEERESAVPPRVAGRGAKPEGYVEKPDGYVAKPGGYVARAGPAVASVAPVARAVAPVVSVAPSRASRSGDGVPSAAAAPAVRAPGAVASASPRSQPLAAGAEASVNGSTTATNAAPAPPSGRRRLPKVIILRPGEPRRVTAFGSVNPPAAGVVHPGSAGMMAANLISSPAPAYPAEAFQARVQGEVTVRAVVDREGNITDARVVSGPELLRSAALEAVQHWRYRPYMRGGKPTEVDTTAIVDFELP